MHAKRVAVACAVTCAVALSAVPLAAQVPAREHRVGIGISFPDVGLFLRGPATLRPGDAGEGRRAGR